MLFNFQAFIAEMRDKADKSEMIEKYETLIGSLDGEIVDQVWYKDYLINFANHSFNVPDELRDEFDWKLLLQLAAASFSSECRFEKQEGGDERELIISVKGGEQVIVKKVSELWSFQIVRLFEIYVEEQISMTVVMKEDPKIVDALLSKRASKLQEWKLMMSRAEFQDEKAKLAEKAEADKIAQLNALKNKLW